MKPNRPALLEFSSVRELFLHFERILLGGGISREIISACGHSIRVFDHHFFHMVKLDDPSKTKPLLMANEKDIILATADGFASYAYDRQRAIYLESAMTCLALPDEVWEDETLASAKWIYIKEFNTSPYSFTIALVGEREESYVPVTSFPGKNRDAKRWRRGRQIYP
jgi:hypothetical protein